MNAGYLIFCYLHFIRFKFKMSAVIALDCFETTELLEC
jgi:hypothetical protein